MKNTKRSIRVGLIGTGFMGKAHAFGFASAPRVFDLPYAVELHTVADVTNDAAAAAARAFGFLNATSDWRSVVTHPDIDVVSVTAPNALHKEMSLAAIAAGKHVYCEKPLAPTAADAAEMTSAAEAAGVRTQVGFNYLCNPMLALAREMVAAGELGEVRGYRGLHAEDYMATRRGLSPSDTTQRAVGRLPIWVATRWQRPEFLLGPISEVMGDCVTMIGERPMEWAAPARSQWTTLVAHSSASPVALRVR